MKILFVLRHAKAKRSHSSGVDHARCLNARGRDAAERIGAYMTNKRYDPDIILCSSSARTIETSQRVTQSLNCDVDVMVDDALYLAEPDRLLKTCQALDDLDSSVLIIGHNPGMQEFALLLVKNRNGPLAQKLLGSFPTGALVVFQFEVEHWSDLAPGRGQLVDLIFPRELPGPCRRPSHQLCM
jgi:phosphohistidine phosphatase